MHALGLVSPAPVHDNETWSTMIQYSVCRYVPGSWMRFFAFSTDEHPLRQCHITRMSYSLWCLPLIIVEENSTNLIGISYIFWISNIRGNKNNAIITIGFHNIFFLEKVGVQNICANGFLFNIIVFLINSYMKCWLIWIRIRFPGDCLRCQHYTESLHWSAVLSDRNV